MKLLAVIERQLAEAVAAGCIAAATNTDDNTVYLS